MESIVEKVIVWMIALLIWLFLVLMGAVMLIVASNILFHTGLVLTAQTIMAVMMVIVVVKLFKIL